MNILIDKCVHIDLGWSVDTLAHSMYFLILRRLVKVAASENDFQER